MMKGFLKSTEGVFQLSPSVTVIGRENSDYVIQSSALEPQHALIEYSEPESCYVLQDLNSAHGTYVNDCRVQNATVRLAPGDIIRFGYAGVPHELELEDAPMISYPPVQMRPAYGSSGLTLINDNIPVSGPLAGAQFPNLTSYNDPAAMNSHQSQLPSILAPQPIHPTGGATTAWGTGMPSNTAGNVVPRPPRPRPSSAGARRGSGSTNGVASAANNSPNNSPLPTRRGVSYTSAGGWVSSAGARTVVTTQQNHVGSPSQRASPMNEVMVLQDKIATSDQRLLRMGDEINRLAVFESESQRKDGLISQLRAEMEQLGLQLHNIVPSGGGDAELVAKVQLLDNDVQRKQLEINALKDKMSRMRVESGDPMDNVANLRSLLHQRDRDQVALRQESERSKKDRAASNSLVTTLQRDLTNRDGTVNRMKGEMEIVKRELREKEVAMSAMSAKFSRVRENKKHEEEMATRNKELISLKHVMNMDIGTRKTQDLLFVRDSELSQLQDKLKGSECKVDEITEQLAAHKEDVEKLEKKLKQEKEACQKAQSERDHAKSQFLEVQRSHETAKTDVDQAQKRLERFRSRIQQAAFSAPGFKVPDEDEDAITDDLIVDAVKKLLDERQDARSKVRDMKDSLKNLETTKKELKNSSKTLKQHLTTMEKRLSEDGRTSNHLLTEIKCLQSVTVDEHFQGVRDSIAMGLQNELTWQQNVENALEKCGFDMKTSGKNIPGLIEGLHKELQSAKSEKTLLKSKLGSAEGNVRQEMTQEIQRLKAEEQMKMSDALEKEKMEGERKLQAAIEEMRQSERKKREEALQLEQEKVRSQEASLAHLRQALTEKTSDEERMLSVENELQRNVQEFATMEAKLKEEIVLQHNLHESATRLLQEQLAAASESQGTQAAAFKEQIKQHSMTMVGLEEQLNKAAKGQQDARTEVSELRKKLHDQTQQTQAALAKLAKPQVPPKPILVQKPSADMQAMEQLIILLKKENGQLKKELQEQQDIILGLRRDLAGASARLSDMRGELSEKQKEELENNRSLIKEQEAELTTQRQQLVKLSELVDKKTKDMEKFLKDLGSQKDLVNKHKQEALMKKDELAHLQKQLQMEEDKSKRALEEVQQEGMITSEMSAQGAQCRGERHDQVINRQREALAELRSRIKGLETNRPPLPTHDQALQQVILLKKELAEMRAKQAQMSNQQNNPVLILDKQIAKARGHMSLEGSEAAIERSARVEIQEAMNKSERSYLDLAQSVGALLGLGEVPGHETMAHLPRDERDRVTKERGGTHELVISRLKTLNQRLERKDQLLKDYEKDLEKLRLAEAIANEKAYQVENLAGDVRGRAEEAQYLRETLRRTRENLDKEKRLNSAIKSKKTFHMENDQKNKQTWPRHKCYNEDKDKQEKQKEIKKKAQKQKILKKEYEVTMLKAELQEKDHQLCDTTARLINLENSVAN